MKTIAPDVECIGPVKAVLGESVSWSPRENSLVWVDIVARQVLRTHIDGKTTQWDFAELTGFVQPTEDGTWLVGQENAILRFDPKTDARRPFVTVERDDPSTRTNDAGCDPQGRLLVGTMRMGELRPVGSLYRIDTQGHSETLDTGLTIPNGIAFSPRGDIAYWAETFVGKRQVWCARYDPDDGTVGEKRPFVQLEESMGLPDGATVDSNGCYWVAAARGWQLLRYTPDGRLDLAVRLPVEKPSKLAFGGPDLDTIFVTSISAGLGDDAREKQPLAGRLIALRVGITGLPPRLFGTLPVIE